jgi:uncharacterized membrane protein
MNGIVIGGTAGAVLAFAALAFGFWGFLLVLVLIAIGALIGGMVTGRLNVRAAADALRGRRTG